MTYPEHLSAHDVSRLDAAGITGNDAYNYRNAGVSALNVKGGMGAWTRAGLPVAR